MQPDQAEQGGETRLFPVLSAGPPGPLAPTHLSAGPHLEQGGEYRKLLERLDDAFVAWQTDETDDGSGHLIEAAIHAVFGYRAALAKEPRP